MSKVLYTKKQLINAQKLTKSNHKKYNEGIVEMGCNAFITPQPKQNINMKKYEK